MGSAVERTVVDMNRKGYRVAFIIPDQWSFGRKVLDALVWACTLGFVAWQEGGAGDRRGWRCLARRASDSVQPARPHQRHPAGGGTGKPKPKGSPPAVPAC